MAAKSNPASWPGVDSLIALLSLGRDEEAPNLRLVLVKSFFSVAVALFSYALAVYDPRWLYRLSARDVNSIAYSQIFGGAGERNIHKVKPPNRPPRKCFFVEALISLLFSPICKASSAVRRSRQHS